MPGQEQDRGRGCSDGGKPQAPLPLQSAKAQPLPAGRNKRQACAGPLSAAITLGHCSPKHQRESSHGAVLSCDAAGMAQLSQGLAGWARSHTKPHGRPAWESGCWGHGEVAAPQMGPQNTAGKSPFDPAAEMRQAGTGLGQRGELVGAGWAAREGACLEMPAGSEAGSCPQPSSRPCRESNICFSPWR